MFPFLQDFNSGTGVRTLLRVDTTGQHWHRKLPGACHVQIWCYWEKQGMEDQLHQHQGWTPHFELKQHIVEIAVLCDFVQHRYCKYKSQVRRNVGATLSLKWQQAIETETPSILQDTGTVNTILKLLLSDKILHNVASRLMVCWQKNNVAVVIGYVNILHSFTSWQVKGAQCMGSSLTVFFMSKQAFF